jgi:hypothetical protein
MKTLILFLLPLFAYSQTNQDSFNELVSLIERTNANKAKLDSLIESMDNLNKVPVDLPNGNYEAVLSGYKLEIIVPCKPTFIVNDLKEGNRCFYPFKIFIIVFNRNIYLMK